MTIAMSVYTGEMNGSGAAVVWPGSWGVGWAGGCFELFAGFLYKSVFKLINT